METALPPGSFFPDGEPHQGKYMIPLGITFPVGCTVNVHSYTYLTVKAELKKKKTVEAELVLTKCIHKLISMWLA